MRQCRTDIIKVSVREENIYRDLLSWSQQGGCLCGWNGKMDFIYIILTNTKYVVSYVHYDPVVDDHWYIYPHAYNYRIKAFSWPKAHVL